MSTSTGPELTEEQNRAQIQGGGRWLYWIAGLSLANSLAVLAGIEFSFVIGLGITQIFDGMGAGFAQEFPDAAVPLRVAALLCSALAAAFVLILGIKASAGRAWAFGAALFFYGADALPLVAFQDWLGVGFHAFALLGIFGGLQAARRERRRLSAREPDPLSSDSLAA